ncbi:MAG TPA: sporulation/spore germination protein [Cyanophyceae cyanobacterium]
MKRIKSYLLVPITGLILVSLSSCGASLASRAVNNANSSTLPQSQPNTLADARPESKAAVATQSLNTTGSKAISTSQATNTITVNIYHADSQCQTLVPEKVEVPSDSPVDAAVGAVLKQVSSGDFDLAGYRVTINPKTHVATVDLRRTPNSERQFLSLSTCEQFALFGSLRKTLVDNSQFQVKDVRFTEQGEDLYL